MENSGGWKEWQCGRIGYRSYRDGIVVYRSNPRLTSEPATIAASCEPVGRPAAPELAPCAFACAVWASLLGEVAAELLLLSAAVCVVTATFEVCVVASLAIEKTVNVKPLPSVEVVAASPDSEEDAESESETEPASLEGAAGDAIGS